jgi:energy-coupling factor transporter ATP-binding protein EcfA2
VTVNRVHIKNFKSIVDLSLDLAPINVFIGENGSGKSNILEALAFAAAADANKLDNEFLVSRGIRVTDPRFIRSAFAATSEGAVLVDVATERGARKAFEIDTLGDSPYPKWHSKRDTFLPPKMDSASGITESTEPSSDTTSSEYKAKLSKLSKLSKSSLDELKALFGLFTHAIPGLEPAGPSAEEDFKDRVALMFSAFDKRYEQISLGDFIIYSPEISALRTFEKEGQILPLGVRGEGLLKLLRVLASEDKAAWHALQDNLSLLDWFSGIDIDHDSSLPEQTVRVRDRFVATSQPAFDQRSANEGFFYLIFFFALILSKATPRFFAIENVDTSLNPKACSELMRRLASLALEHQKQILFTTHNPSLLDGLNLHDDRQRLFVVFRNTSGHTTARRIMPPKPVGDELPIKLSEAFTRGLLGGIPQNF